MWYSKSWFTLVWYSKSWFTPVWYNKSWFTPVWYSKSWFTLVWYSKSWFTPVWYRKSWLTPVWYSKACFTPVKYSIVRGNPQTQKHGSCLPRIGRRVNRIDWAPCVGRIGQDRSSKDRADRTACAVNRVGRKLRWRGLCAYKISGTATSGTVRRNFPRRI